MNIPKIAETALAAHTKKGGKWKGGKAKDSKTDKTDLQCGNCKKKGHTNEDCWAKGRGKEGQGPKQKKKDKSKTAIVAADEEDTQMFDSHVPLNMGC